MEGGENIKYLVIPKDVIYNSSLDENRVIVYSYFSLKQGLDDTVGFSCNHVVKWCGYAINYHKGKINDKVCDLIEQLSHNQYFSIEGKISSDILTVATLNMEKFFPDNQFAIIYYDEIHKVKSFKKLINDEKEKNRMSAAILLLVLSYLRMNMLRRQNGFIGEESNKPEFCYRYYMDIEKDIGISRRSISKAVNILVELDLIAKTEIPRYKDESGNWHTEVTLFVNKHKYKSNGEIDLHYNYKQELQWGVDYIKEKKYQKKKFYQNTESK